LSFVQSALAEFRDPRKKQRRALELVAEELGAREAYFFAKDAAGRPDLVCQLGATNVPAELSAQVTELFAQYLDEQEETLLLAAVPEAHPSLTELQTVSYNLFPLVVSHGSEVRLIGAIGLPRVPDAGAVGQRVLEYVAQELYSAGDVPTTPLLAQGPT
jgi:hypothetical protein